MSIKGLILGFFCGDMAGVPFEHFERDELAIEPATDLIGYRSHNQPIGSWSDDSSMVWCTVDAILDGYSTRRLTDYFLSWVAGEYNANNFGLFDIGITTRAALMKAAASNNKAPDNNNTVVTGMASEWDNGNGSIMRCIPQIALLRPLGKVQRFHLVKDASSITHAHIRSILACFYFTEYLMLLEDTKDKFEAYRMANASLDELFQLEQLEIPTYERPFFLRIMSGEIHLEPEDSISSSGYVIDTVETVLYVFLNTEDGFRQGVLKALNLGFDTDTNAALVGCLLGLHLGYDSIPEDWISKMKRKDEIISMAERFEKYYHDVYNESRDKFGFITE